MPGPPLTWHHVGRLGIAERQGQLGLPPTTVANARYLDPLTELGRILEAEANRTIAGEVEQLAAEIEQAWTDDTLPPLAARLDPARYGFLQDQVARTRQHATLT